MTTNVRRTLPWTIGERPRSSVLTRDCGRARRPLDAISDGSAGRRALRKVEQSGELVPEGLCLVVEVHSASGDDEIVSGQEAH